MSTRKLLSLLNNYYPLGDTGFCKGEGEVSQMMLADSQSADLYVGWGFKSSSIKVRECAQKFNKPYWALEDAFVRSFDLSEKGDVPLGVVLDQRGIYYKADVACDLEVFVRDEELSDAQILQASRAISQIKNQQLSKYNSISCEGLDKYGLEVFDSFVLVVDQVYGDDSIAGGLACAQSFTEMLGSACNENPDSNILLKVHPDVFTNESKRGYFDLEELESNSSITIISERVNPWGLFEVVDKVYTVTSQMGFEALMAGKEVHCFGMPFYAGWGLTYDRQVCERRTRERTVEEVFYFAYIKYARYINPFLKRQAGLSEVCHLISDQRRHAELNLYHNVCLGFSPWKKKFISDFVGLTDVTRLKHISQESQMLDVISSVQADGMVTVLLQRALDAVRKGLKLDVKKKSRDDSRFSDLPSRVIVWASSSYAQSLKESSGEFKDSKGRNAPVVFMEDGFLRSVGLGADLARPYSLVLDTQGIYYDATKTSDLERLLERYDFFDCDLDRARVLRQSLLELRLSKYNFSERGFVISALPSNRKIILVPGQVQDDASIQKGCVDIQTNLGLLKEVRAQNPEAFIVYKQHPDVLKSGRKGGLTNSEVFEYSDFEAQTGSVIDWIERVDEVHTMTSLAGFEALLREKKVVTYGLPFYAGWGLTKDRHVCERRTRKRTLDELVAAALIYYPTYVDPVTRQVCNVETIVERLAQNLDKPHKPSMKTRLIRVGQRIRNRVK